jgi:hypothetical protein
MSFNRFILGAAAGAVSLAASAQANNPWTYHESDDGTGRIYYYESTNTDGSMDGRAQGARHPPVMFSPKTREV